MSNQSHRHVPLCAGLFALGVLSLFPAPVVAQSKNPRPQMMPSGQIITPLAAKGARFSQLNPKLTDFPSYTACQAVKTAVSPDGSTLLILTSGFNRINDIHGRRVARDSNEYVFVYDITLGRLRQEQVLQVPNTFFGVAFAPGGREFYVSGGIDDNIHVFARSNGLPKVLRPSDSAILKASAFIKAPPSQV